MTKKKKRGARCAAAANARAAGASGTPSSDSASTPSALPAKHARFVAEYLIDGNATRAAKACGYHPKTAALLIARDSIRAAIVAGQTRQLDQAELTGQMVVDRLRLLGFQDIRRLFDADGNLIPIYLLSDAAAATIGGVEVVVKNISPADGHTDLVHKIKIIDPVEPLALLAKKFGLLVEKIELKTITADARVARLVAARKRTDKPLKE
jgi:phage terminase small subunit